MSEPGSGANGLGIQECSVAFLPACMVVQFQLSDESDTVGVHLNFRAGSTFPFPVCTVPSSMDRTSRCNKVDAVRLYASYRLNFFFY